jgi:hypothetical protein
MADSIDEDAVARVDDVVDPTDLNAAQIESELSGTGDFDGDAASAFANRVSQARDPVRRAASDQLVDQISEPGANGQRQLYGPNPETGRNTFVGTAENVDFEVTDSGDVLGVNTNTGTRAKVGSVDLNERDL